MDNSLRFHYSTIHHAHHPDSYPTCSNESVEDSGSIENGPPLVPFALPSDSAALQFSREACFYSPVGTPVSQMHMRMHADATCWTGSGLEEGPSDMLRLYAPIPLPGCAPILRSNSCCPEEYPVSESRPVMNDLTVQHSTDFQQPDHLHMQRCDYAGGLPLSNVTVPQLTFPTPSDLLVELYNQGNHSQQTPHPTFRRERYSSAYVVNKPHRPTLSFQSAHNVIEPVPDASLLAPSSSDSTSESITSHEKKRHYLECLEHYVGFLHDHFHHNGIKPASLEQISSYRCLNSRSIRSLLIHMEKTTKRMKEQIFREEQKFLRLRQALQQQEGGLEVVQSGMGDISLGK